jgi:hypothetical protein
MVRFGWLAYVIGWTLWASQDALAVQAVVPLTANPITPAIYPHGFTVTLPQPPNKASRKSGLSVTLDTRWANNYGYRPVQLTFSSTTPTTADRTITVKLHATSWMRQWGNTTVEQELQMQQGSTSATMTVAVPQFNQFHWTGGGQLWWEIWVDGSKDYDLSIAENAGQRFITNAQTPRLTVLILQPKWSTANAISSWRENFEFLSVPADKLPRRWFDYSSLDIVQLSAADFIDIA